MNDETDLEFVGRGLVPGEGIRKADFQNWKHHPVSKIVLRFFDDYARQVRREQVDSLRNASSSPDPFVLGMFNGRINAYAEMSAIEFEHLMSFYPVEEEQEDDIA